MKRIVITSYIYDNNIHMKLTYYRYYNNIHMKLTINFSFAGQKRGIQVKNVLVDNIHITLTIYILYFSFAGQKRGIQVKIIVITSYI